MNQHQTMSSFQVTTYRGFIYLRDAGHFSTQLHRRQDSAQRSRKKKGCWLFWDSYTHLGAHTIILHLYAIYFLNRYME